MPNGEHEGADVPETRDEWLGARLPGGRNALWDRAIQLLTAGRFEDLESELARWTCEVAGLDTWHLFGKSSGQQARDLAVASAQAYRALAAQGRGDFEAVPRFLRWAGESFLAAISGRGPLPPAEDPGPEPATLDDAMKRWDDARGGQAVAAAMVRSLLASAIEEVARRPGDDRKDPPGLGGLVGKLLPGEPTWRVVLPLLLVAGAGRVHVLTLESFEGRSSESVFVPDPEALGATTFDAAFARSLESAWALHGGEFPPGTLVRWRISMLAEERWLTGDSAGGALAAGLHGLVHRSRFDRVALTATIGAGGALGGVGEIREKIRAANESGIHKVLFSVENEDDLSGSGFECRFSPILVDNLAAAIPLLKADSGSVWQFLGRRRAAVDQGVPGPRPRDLPASSQCYIPARVAPRRSEAGAPSDPIFWQDSRWSGPTTRKGQTRAVILAGPGLGKTALLRRESWSILSEQVGLLERGEAGLDDLVLPVLIRLPDLAKAKKGATERSISDAMYALMTDPSRGGQTIPPEVEPWARRCFEDGRVALLLDDLDLLPETDYIGLMLEVDEWVRLKKIGRVVIASRPAGFRGLPPDLLPSHTELVDLVGLNRPEIDRFVRCHFGELGADRAKALGGALDQSPSLAGMARTPLLLGILCDRFERTGSSGGSELSSGHARLFSECLMGPSGLLNRTFIRAGGFAHEPTPQDTERLLKTRALIVRLARALSGDDPGRTSFNHLRLIDAFGQCREELASFGLEKEPLDSLINQDGLLCYTGDGTAKRYEFVHRGFQEFLLAWDLGQSDDWLEDATHPSRLYDPAWAEVLVYLAGVLDLQDAEADVPQPSRSARYIEALLAKTAEDILARPALLAFRAAAEAPSLPAGRAEALARLAFDLIQKPPSYLSSEALIEASGPMGDKIVAVIREISKTRSGGEQDELSRFRSRFAVPERGPISTLAPRKADDPDRDLRAIATLLDPATEPGKKTEAAEHLAGLTGARDGAVEALVAALGDRDDRNVPARAGSARALGLIGLGRPSGRITILPALRVALTDPDADVRRAAATALGRLGPHDRETRDALEAAMEDDNRHVRAPVVSALGRSGRDAGGNLLTAAVLMNKGLTDQSPEVALRAARALARFGPVDPAVVGKLLGFLDLKANALGASGALGWVYSRSKRPLGPAEVPPRVAQEHREFCDRLTL